MMFLLLFLTLHQLCLVVLSRMLRWDAIWDDDTLYHLVRKTERREEDEPQITSIAIRIVHLFLLPFCCPFSSSDAVQLLSTIPFCDLCCPLGSLILIHFSFFSLMDWLFLIPFLLSLKWMIQRPSSLIQQHSSYYSRCDDSWCHPSLFQKILTDAHDSDVAFIGNKF